MSTGTVQHTQVSNVSFSTVINYLLLTCRNISSILLTSTGKKFKRLIVDEAHDGVNGVPKRVPVWKTFWNLAACSGLQIIALTGTLPPHLYPAFLTLTGLNRNTLLIRASADRPEIGYHIVNVTMRTVSLLHHAARLAANLEIGLRDDERIIFFFKSNEECENFGQIYPCSIYHSKIIATLGYSKEYNLGIWDSGENKVLASTTAAATGIDRPYIKYTVVVDNTYGLLTFSQETGRGGRRGEYSYGIILRNPNHHTCHNYGRRLDHPEDVKCTAAMQAFVVNVGECRRYKLLKSLDGETLCDKRQPYVTCKQIANANQCDICEPNSEMALRLKSAVNTPIRTPTPPPVPTPSLPAVTKSSQNYFDDDDISLEILMEVDKIEQACSVRPSCASIFVH